MKVITADKSDDRRRMDGIRDNPLVRAPKSQRVSESSVGTLL